MTFATPKGPLGLLAEATVKGKTLHLENIVVYACEQESLVLGTAQLRALQKGLLEGVKGMGFDKLRVTGSRLTGANPGRLVERIFDLTK